MFCTSRIQAERVSIAGALKMDAQGYSIERVTDTLVWVNLPADRKHTNPNGGYLVETDAENVRLFGNGEFCTCKFAEINKRFGVCKHVEYAQYRLAEDAANDARIAAMEDYNAYGRFDLDDDSQPYRPQPAITLHATATATAAPKTAPRVYPSPAPVDGFTDSDLCAVCGTPRDYTEEGGALSFCYRCESRQ